MKNLFLVLIAILAMVVNDAGVLFAADDVNIDIKNGISNTVTATGGNATQNQEQNQEQSQSQSADAASNAASNSAASSDNSVVFEDKREFLAAPPYPGFVNPGIPLDTSGWEFYCPPGLSVVSWDENERMINTFRFSDVWAWNWEKRIFFTPIGESLPEKDLKDVYFQCDAYWPMNELRPGDKILGIVKVSGEPDWTEAAFAAKANKKCYDEKRSTRVIKQFRRHTDSVTKGRSLGLGGAASQVSGATGIVGAVGGQIGDNRVKAEEYPEFEALCMNDAPVVQATQKTVEKIVYIEKSAPVVEQPKPEPSCDASKDLWWIGKLERKLQDEVNTPKFHFRYENLKDRMELGRRNLNVFACTRDRKYLDGAIYHLEVAERNRIYGDDLHLYYDADALIAQVEYDLRTAIHHRDGSLNAYYHPIITDIPVIRDVRARKGIKWERNEVLKLRLISGRYATEIKP